MRLTIGLMALLALFGTVAFGSAAAWAGPDFQVEYRFAGKPDGAAPIAGLTKVDGKLYGVTQFGGKKRTGTIFSFEPTTGVKSTVYEFKDAKDGSVPEGRLIKIAARLYGTNSTGGPHGCGTVFSFDPTTGVERTLHSFACAPDGGSPYGGLTDVGGTLYGTTVLGGANGGGTIFSVDRATGVETVLFSFVGNFTDSMKPGGDLIYVGGKLYGTAAEGGRGKSPCSNGCGSIFSFDPTTGAEALVHLFQNSDGSIPSAGLIEVDGELYGTTAYSETNANCPFGCGVVFSLDPESGEVKVLYPFKGGADGAQPFSDLVDVGDKLYGTTYLGGTDNLGTVFSIEIASKTEKVDHSFSGHGHGSYPKSILTGIDGRLYGTTTDCYNNICKEDGTIFSIRR